MNMMQPRKSNGSSQEYIFPLNDLTTKPEEDSGSESDVSDEKATRRRETRRSARRKVTFTDPTIEVEKMDQHMEAMNFSSSSLSISLSSNISNIRLDGEEKNLFETYNKYSDAYLMSKIDALTTTVELLEHRNQILVSEIEGIKKKMDISGRVRTYMSSMQWRNLWRRKKLQIGLLFITLLTLSQFF